MTKPNALRTVLAFLSVATFAASVGVSHAQSLATNSPGQPPSRPAVQQPKMMRPVMGNSPTVRISSRQTGATAEAGVQSGRLIHMMTPLYPPAAIKAHISGVVTIDARIGKDGRIVDANVVSGPVALRRVAQYAVKRWRYEPTLLNGQAIERVTQVDLSFVLGRY